MSISKNKIKNEKIDEEKTVFPFRSFFHSFFFLPVLMGRLFTALLVLVGTASIAGFYLSSVFHEPVVSGDQLTVHEAALTGLADEAPNSLLKPDGTYHFGRWKQSIKDLTLKHEVEPRAHEGIWKTTQDFIRLKRWDYVSLVNPQFFLAVCMVNFNYIEDVFVYLVELEHPEKKSEFHSRRLPALGLDFAPSSQVIFFCSFPWVQ